MYLSLIWTRVQKENLVWVCHCLPQAPTFAWPSRSFYHYLHVDIWGPGGQTGPLRVLLGCCSPLCSALTPWSLLVSQRALCRAQLWVWEQPVRAAVKQSLDFNIHHHTHKCTQCFLCATLSVCQPLPFIRIISVNPHTATMIQVVLLLFPFSRRGKPKVIPLVNGRAGVWA